MTNSDKLDELFPEIPEYSGIDYWGDFWEEEFIPDTCKMIEVCNEITCSSCGVRISDEIYYMFKRSKEDFKYCPCCGRKIE